MTGSGSDVVVQKYGGTSVATPEKICAIADRIGKAQENQRRIVVVLSAMGKTTDQLVALAHSVAKKPGGREMDLLLATGEQVSVSVLGLALQDRGIPAISLTATQCGIRTDDAYNIARIESIDTKRIVQELDRDRVVIVTGFQGLTRDQEVTTLGRGGSDITGAALAAALGASACDICTDVDVGPMDITNQLRVGLKRHRAPGFMIHGCAKAFKFGTNPSIQYDRTGSTD